MEKYSLISFMSFMVLCATLVISVIWLAELAPVGIFQLAASSFVLGLASFIVWSFAVFYRVSAKLVE